MAGERAVVGELAAVAFQDLSYAAEISAQLGFLPYC